MRYSGIIGFVCRQEDPVGSGIWKNKPIERRYYGDVVKNYRRWETASEQVNDNVNISNTISIVADSFAEAHLAYIRYAEYSGQKWNVTSVEVQRPRLILSIGGVYNGPQN